MSLEIYKLHGLEATQDNPANPGNALTTFFTQLTSTSLTPGLQKMVERASGDPHPAFSATTTKEAEGSFTTSNIEQILNLIPVNGVVWNDANIYLKGQGETGPKQRATAEHGRVTVARMIAYWTTIRIPNNAKAEIDLTLVCLPATPGEPIFTWNGTVQLPAAQNSAKHFWTCGPCWLKGNKIAGIQQYTIESGTSIKRVFGDGQAEPCRVELMTTEPTITVQTLQPINFTAAIGEGGTALNPGSDTAAPLETLAFQLFFRKFAMGTTSAREPETELKHIMAQATWGEVSPINASVQGEASWTDEFKIQCTRDCDDDETLPIAFAVNVAIEPPA